MFQKFSKRAILALFSAVFLLAMQAVRAQAPAGSLEPPPTPRQTSAAPAVPLNPTLPTVFIIGDSTARNEADLGWGDHLAHYLDTARINVANRAIAGRSSRSYIREGAWDRVLDQMKPGDYVLLQMGHNDGGELDGPKARGSLKGLSAETEDVTLPDGRIETVHTYGWYMRKYIADTRAKQATPQLLSLTIRNIWTPGPDGKLHIERDMGYDAELRQIAEEEHVAYIDMLRLKPTASKRWGRRGPLCFSRRTIHTLAPRAPR